VKKVISVVLLPFLFVYLVLAFLISIFVAFFVGTGYWTYHVITNYRGEHRVTDKWPVSRDFHIKCTWGQHFYVAFMITTGKFIGNFGG